MLSTQIKSRDMICPVGVFLNLMNEISCSCKYLKSSVTITSKFLAPFGAGLGGGGGGGGGGGARVTPK